MTAEIFMAKEMGRVTSRITHLIQQEVILDTQMALPAPHEVLALRLEVLMQIGRAARLRRAPMAECRRQWLHGALRVCRCEIREPKVLILLLLRALGDLHLRERLREGVQHSQ
jgi:hypothetical protein